MEQLKSEFAEREDETRNQRELDRQKMQELATERDKANEMLSNAFQRTERLPPAGTCRSTLVNFLL